MTNNDINTNNDSLFPLQPTLPLRLYSSVYLYFYLSLSLSSFFEFPFHPDWSKQMAAFQTWEGGGLLEVASHRGVFPGRCRFMLALEGSVGFLVGS